jgi:hypothetical protein
LDWARDGAGHTSDELPESGFDQEEVDIEVDVDLPLPCRCDLNNYPPSSDEAGEEEVGAHVVLDVPAACRTGISLAFNGYRPDIQEEEAGSFDEVTEDLRQYGTGCLLNGYVPEADGAEAFPGAHERLREYASSQQGMTDCVVDIDTVDEDLDTVEDLNSIAPQPRAWDV